MRPTYRGRDSAALRCPSFDASRPRAPSILELFYASGLRLSELVGLDLGDLNLSARMVRVMGKGRKERLVPFNTATKDAVAAWLKDRAAIVRPAGDALFVNARGSRLTGRSVQRFVSRYVSGCSTRFGIAPHALRHSFATQSCSSAPTARHPGAGWPRAAIHHPAATRTCNLAPVAGDVSPRTPASAALTWSLVPRLCRRPAERL